jgi:Fic family protein
MTWNWQAQDWPNWRYDIIALEEVERQFLLRAGALAGAWSHLPEADRDTTSIELLTQEAIKTSAIEGEFLDRASVQSSMRREFGLTADRRAGASESGIAELMASGFHEWEAPLTERMLFFWHQMLCRGRDDLKDKGNWRQGGDPMQVVSGPIQKPRIHFEAPPAMAMADEMTRFILWFNKTSPSGSETLPALTRAGLAHLYFVSVHPFEDGNGRIARAISEKALAQAAGHPSLTALSVQIERHRKHYYDALEANNKSMDVTGWLVWFAKSVLAAQHYTLRLVGHIVSKTHVMDRLRNQMNARQTSVLLRMFAAGPEGFIGGLSAKNYISIADTSPATARRDLAELVNLGALRRTGENRGTRYWLILPENEITGMKTTDSGTDPGNLIGFMKSKVSIPNDFSEMFAGEIQAMFEGSSIEPDEGR